MINKSLFVLLITMIFITIYKYIFTKKEKLINISSDYILGSCDVPSYIKIHDKIDVIVNGYEEDKSENIIDNCKIEGQISSDCVNKVLSITNSLEEAEKLCKNTDRISENCVNSKIKNYNI